MKVLRLILWICVVAAPASLPAQRVAPKKTLTAFASDDQMREWLRKAVERQAHFRDSLARAEAAAYDSAYHCRTVVTRARAADTNSTVLRVHVTDAARKDSSVGLQYVGVVLAGRILGQTAKDGWLRADIPTRLVTGDSLLIGLRRLGYRPRSTWLHVAAGDSITVDANICQDHIFLESVVTSAAGADNGITNVQDAGVDEGGIVKLHRGGDYLIVLNRGRLHTIRIGGGRLEPVESVPAYGPDVNPQYAWYDELMLSGDRIAVVGYSYQRGGTEIGLFHLDRAGHVHYESTYQLRSHDYYSSRNYASRLIGTKLVFYAPLYLPSDTNTLLTALPAVRRWTSGDTDRDESAFIPIMSSRRTYPPARWYPSLKPTLHTVTVCDLASRTFECRATVLVGPAGRVYYVSPNAVYVWTSGYARDPQSPIDVDKGMVESHEKWITASTLYRMPLDGSAPSAVDVRGVPIDQFSFLESADGRLNVVVQARAMGESMWGSEEPHDNLSLMSVSIAQFGDSTASAPPSSYRAIGSVGSGAIHNRFVGDYVLVGAGNGWGRPRTHPADLLVTSWRDARDPVKVSLPHGADRIEAIGRDALVVGSDSLELHFTGIRLQGDAARPVQHYAVPNAVQGELRSHGFFYKPSSRQPGTGMFGLPVRGGQQPGWRHLIDASAGIVFVRNTGDTFTGAGELVSRDSVGSDEKCQASCVDWYGNSRPLFVGERVFALLGAELVEGTERHERLVERRRVNYQKMR